MSDLLEPQYTLRAGNASDSHDVARVNIEAFRSALQGVLSAQYLAGLSHQTRADSIRARFDQPGYRMQVAVDENGRVIGFADWGPPREEIGHDCELYAIYVDPSQQGRGVGRLLFKRVAQVVLVEGMGSIVLSVFSENPYRAFYDKLGGIEVGRSTIGIEDEDHALHLYGWDREALLAMAAF